MLKKTSVNFLGIVDYEEGLNELNGLHLKATQQEKAALQTQWDWINVQKLGAVEAVESVNMRCCRDRLEKNVFRIKCALRFGVDICTPHT